MLRVLMVDDDECFGQMLQAMLKQLGCEVVRAYEGGEALRLYQQQPFDLVLTDLVMPEKEGTELIIQIRKINKEAKIIAMSGAGLDPNRLYLSAAQLLGADSTLSKPFSIKQLSEAIKALFPDEALK